MKQFLYLFLISIVVLVACKKDKGIHPDLYNTWEAKSFVSIDSRAYNKNENTKILLTLYKNGTYRLRLDINSCSGEYTVDSNNRIIFSYAACTEACCDSEFSLKLIEMLSKVSSYNIDGNSLQVNVSQWGFISFELVR